ERYRWAPEGGWRRERKTSRSGEQTSPCEEAGVLPPPPAIGLPSLRGALLVACSSVSFGYGLTPMVENSRRLRERPRGKAANGGTASNQPSGAWHQKKVPMLPCTSSGLSG